MGYVWEAYVNTSEKDQEVIDKIENAAELGNTEAERVVKQTGQEKGRKFMQDINKYKLLNR